MGKMEKDEREMICDEGMTMRKEQMTGQTPWKCVGNVQALQVSSERRDEIDAAAPDYFWMEQDDSGKESGISNWGMKKGMRFEKGRTYRFSCYAKGETMYSKIMWHCGTKICRSWTGQNFTHLRNGKKRNFYSIHLKPWKTAV